jgi:hypothetical protein
VDGLLKPDGFAPLEAPPRLLNGAQMYLYSYKHL